MAQNNLIKFHGLAAGSLPAAAAMIHAFGKALKNRYKVSKRAALLMDRAIKSIYKAEKIRSKNRKFVCI